MSTKISLSFLTVTGTLLGVETAPSLALFSNIQNLVTNHTFNTQSKVTNLTDPRTINVVAPQAQKTSENSGLVGQDFDDGQVIVDRSTPVGKVDQGAGRSTREMLAVGMSQIDIFASDVATIGASHLLSANLPSEQSEIAIEIPVPPPLTWKIGGKSTPKLPPIAKYKINTDTAPIPTISSDKAAAARNSHPTTTIDRGEYDSTAAAGYPLLNIAPITSRFGWRTHPLTGIRRFHSGVDIGAPMGSPVVAAGSGTVISAGWNGGYGKAIIIEHNGVQQTLYGHLSEISVQPGQVVTQGTVIGLVGSTGNSTGPHLHFESRMSTADGWVAIDPGDDIKYAMDHLNRSAPFVRRDLPPGI